MALRTSFTVDLISDQVSSKSTRRGFNDIALCLVSAVGSEKEKILQKKRKKKVGNKQRRWFCDFRVALSLDDPLSGASASQRPLPARAYIYFTCLLATRGFLS